MIILIVKVAAVFLVAALCYLTYYSFHVDKVAGYEINYRQWLGITIISTLLFHKPTEQPEKLKNDSEGPQIP